MRLHDAVALHENAQTMKAETNHRAKIATVLATRDLCLARVPRYSDVLETFPFNRNVPFYCPKNIGFLLRAAGSRSKGSSLLSDYRQIAPAKQEAALKDIMSLEGKDGLNLLIAA